MELLTVIIWLVALVLILFVIFSIISHQNNGPLTPHCRSMTNQIIVITGADSSIGFQTSLELLEQNAIIIFACRSKEHAEERINSLQNPIHKSRAIFIQLDLNSFDSIIEFIRQLKEKVEKIDILINNAGTCYQYFQAVDGVEKTLFTNYLGHLLLTILLWPMFNPKGRVVTLSTIKYKRYTQQIFEKLISKDNYDFSYTKKTYDWMKYYVFSKLADMFLNEYLNFYINEKGLDIKSVAVHPGYVRNPFFKPIRSLYMTFRDFVMIPFRWCFFKSIKMGAQTSWHVCFIKYEELIGGGFYKDCAHTKKKPIMTLENSKAMMKYTKEILWRNNILKKYRNEITEFLTLE